MKIIIKNKNRFLAISTEKKIDIVEAKITKDRWNIEKADIKLAKKKLSKQEKDKILIDKYL